MTIFKQDLDTAVFWQPITSDKTMALKPKQQTSVKHLYEKNFLSRCLQILARHNLCYKVIPIVFDVYIVLAQQQSCDHG